MTLLKVQILDAKREAEGFVAMVKRGRVLCHHAHTYEVAREQLKALDQLGVRYKVLKEEGLLDALGTLRNPRSAKV